MPVYLQDEDKRRKVQQIKGETQPKTPAASAPQTAASSAGTTQPVRAGMPKVQTDRSIAAAPAYLQYQSGVHADSGGLHRKINYDFDKMTWDDVYYEAANRLRSDEERDAMVLAYQAHVGGRKQLDTLRAGVDSKKSGGAYASTKAATKAALTQERMEINAKISETRNQQRAAQHNAITALNGLDVIGFDGNAIDWNTISFEDAVRMTRLIPDDKTRKAALKGIKAMTEDGGRFASHKAYDLTDSANKYIANSDFDLDAYERFIDGDEYTNGVRGSFSASAGDSEENRAIYEGHLAKIEESDMTPYQKHWYRRGLDEAYTEATGKKYAAAGKTAQNAMEAAPDVAAGGKDDNVPTSGDKAPEEAEKPSASVWSVMIPKHEGRTTPQKDRIAAGMQAKESDERGDSIDTSLEDAPDAPTPSVPAMPAPTPVPVEGEDYARVADVASAGTSSGGRWIDSRLEAAQDAMETPRPMQPPEQEQETQEPEAAMPYGTVHLVDDPVRAAEYVLSGRGAELDQQTQETVNALRESSTAANAILGGWHYDIQRLAYDPGIEGQRYQNMGNTGLYGEDDISYVIGGRLGGYYNKTRNDAFPPELTADAIGMILDVAMEAEAAYENGRFTYDPLNETLYDGYLRENPQALANLDGVFRGIYEMQKEKREQDRLVSEAAEATRQAQIASAQAAMRSGSYTPDQYDLVVENAPVVTLMDAADDPMWSDYRGEISAFVREGYGDAESWIGREVSAYMEASGLSNRESTAALDYRDMLGGYIEEQLMNDLRAAKALGYENLDAYYARQGGFSVELLADRAKIALQEFDAQIDDDTLATAQMYTGGNDSTFKAIAGGATTGVLDTGADYLEAIWTIDNARREDRPLFEQRMREKYTQEYGISLAPYMYRQDMLEFAQAHPSAEMGSYIQQYIDSGADVFRLAIEPEMTWSLEKAAEWNRKAQGLRDWAHANLTPEAGRTFERSESAGSNALMQTVATMTTIVTGSSSIGTAVGFGLPTMQDETEAQLADGKSLKYASTMGMAKAANTILAESATSGKLTDKILRLTGVTQLAEMAGSVVTRSKTVNAMIGLLKESGGQLFDELVLDEIKEGIGWQAIGSFTESMLTTSELMTSILAGVRSIDAGAVTSDVTANMTEGFWTMLPNIFISGVSGAMDGWKATRQAAQKVAQTGSTEAAREFVQSFVQDVQSAENRAELDEIGEAAALGTEATGIMMTDPEVVPVVEAAMEAQEQADAHAQEAASSQARMNADMQVIIDVNDRIVAGDLDKSLPALMGSAAADHNKAKQGLDEHTREEAQKRSDADRHMSEAFAAAKTKAGQTHEIQKQQLRDAISSIDVQAAEQVAAENNIAMDTEEFIQANYPDANEEQKEEIRRRFAEADKRTPYDVPQNVVQFASSIAGKFKVPIKFVDTLDGAEGEYDGKSVIIARDASQGEVMRKVMIHELTHRAESSSKLYRKLSGMILDMKYGGNQEQMDADIRSITSRYQEHYRVKGRTDTFTEANAKAEIVADYMGEIVSGNQEMIDRLVAEKPGIARRIANAIKDFIDRMRGVRDPELDRMRHAVDLLEGALLDAENADMVAQYAVSVGSHYDYSKPFAEQIEDWRKGNVPKGAPLLVGGTPKILQKIGLSNIPMTINDEHIGHAIRGTKADHKMSWEMLAHLPELLENPIAIIQSESRPNDSVVVLVDATINGKQTVSPITIQTTTEMNNVQIDANHLASTYGKYDDAVALFEAAVKKENAKHKGIGVYYVDKNRASNLISDPRLRLPNVSDTGGLIHSIFDAGSSVNRKYLEQTETRQFRRWFSGSQIKNADGTPKIMYRGGSEDIEIFDRKKSKPSNLYGRGFYFTAEESQAAAYGDVHPYYLSVKHPLSANGKKNITEDQMRAFLEAVAEDEDYGLENYGYGATVDSVLNSLRGKDDFSALQDINATAIGDFVAAVELFNQVNGTNYDGIVTPTETVVFRSEQIKSADKNVGLFDPQNPNVRYSLPSSDTLDAEIRAWRAGRFADITTAVKNDGISQFSDQTVQRAEGVPEAIKREFRDNPLLRSYQKDTNADQYARAMQNIEEDGYENEVRRLLNAETFDAEDTVEAGAIAISAFEGGDVKTGLEMALKYRMVRTEQAQALQSGKLFAGMTPEHIKLKVAGNSEMTLADYIRTHEPKAKDINAKAQTVAEEIRGLIGGDELRRLNAQSSFTIDESNSRWGVPINEKQEALIRHYKLEKTARPGIHYNRANLKQRMLEAIIATPDPDADSGNGLSLIQRLEWMKAGQSVVTQADLDYIASQIELYTSMSIGEQAGRDGDLALARAYEAYGNIAPASLMEKARTWRYTAMLLSLPSSVRNIVGNTAMNAVNAVTHDTVGVFTDWAVSLFTGQRTKAMLTMKERADGWNAFANETVNTFRDYFIDKADAAPNAQEENRFNKNQRGRVFQWEVPEQMRIIEGFLMSVGDRNFWKKAYINSLAEQQRVAEMNGRTLDYNEACEIARAEANYATFNEDGFVRSWLSQARQNPMVGFALDMIMPFTGVPTNITKRMIEYSPIGLAATTIKHLARAASGSNFDQKSFVEGVSRGLSGTALFAIGFGIRQLGLIFMGTGDEEDSKVYNLKASMGEQYSPFIRVGDEYISLAFLAPAVSPIIMGATAYDVLKEDDDKVQAFTNAVMASMDQIFDASYMSGLSDLFDKNGKPVQNALETLATNAISQNVPAFMTQIATDMDPYVRDTKDKNAIMQAVKSGIVARIPVIREQFLPEKTDIAGQPFESKEGLRNFFDPLTTTKVNDDPAMAELDRLYDATGSSAHIPTYLIKNSGKINIFAKIADSDQVAMDRSKGEEKLVLTSEERNRYNRLYGSIVFDGAKRGQYQGIGNMTTEFMGIRELMETPEYQRAGDEERADMIGDILTYAKNLTHAQIVIDKGYLKEGNDE